MTTFSLIAILLFCACLALLGGLIIGGLALFFTLRNRNEELAPIVSSITAAEAENFASHFLETMGHGNHGGDLMPLIAPSFIAEAQGTHQELRVNKFSIGAVKILRVDPPFVDVKISHHQPPRPRWAREQTYKLTCEHGQLYIMPSGVGKYDYINPWWADAPITRGQKLVFYALDDPDQSIEKATPRFKARYLKGKYDFSADLAPAMLVDSKAAILAGDLVKVAAQPNLSKQVRDELDKLQAWIEEVPHPFIGFQIEE